MFSFIDDIKIISQVSGVILIDKDCNPFLNITDTSVIIIDMQRGFLLDHPYQEELIKAHVELLSWARLLNLSLIVLEYSGFGDTVSVLMQEARKFEKSIFLKKYRSGCFSKAPFQNEKLHI